MTKKSKRTIQRSNDLFWFTVSEDLVLGCLGPWSKWEHYSPRSMWWRGFFITRRTRNWARSWEKGAGGPGPTFKVITLVTLLWRGPTSGNLHSLPIYFQPRGLSVQSMSLLEMFCPKTLSPERQTKIPTLRKELQLAESMGNSRPGLTHWPVFFSYTIID